MKYVLLLQPTTEIREESLCAKIREFYHFVIVIISNQKGEASQIAGEKWLTRRGEGMKERLTTYHCGKAVIKDKDKLSEAMEKLAKLEDEQEHGSWIPCSERLPDKYMECLVTVNKKHPTHGFTDVFVVEDTYFECEGEFDWQSKFEGMDWNIVAWMELPKPFKEDEISVCEKEACQYYDGFSDGVDKAN